MLAYSGLNWVVQMGLSYGILGLLKDPLLLSDRNHFMASNRTGVSQRFQFDVLVITPYSEKLGAKRLSGQDVDWQSNQKTVDY